GAGQQPGSVSALRVLSLVLRVSSLDRGTFVRAGFTAEPQEILTQDSVELYCEAIGNPIPEIQWWFEGNDPNDTYAQLWDGARQDRVKINATYNLHSTSTISIANLTSDDSGMYECRASNDPDRNHLSKSPKWPRQGLGTCSDTGVLSLLPCSPPHLCPVAPESSPHPPTPAVELRDSHPLSISPPLVT
uniref:Ig-like domain-containing protein n=1 Tax=Malurus cyaneus samueli TaxID=2593467 RepID=A0A8C5UEM4_9PASS